MRGRSPGKMAFGLRVVTVEGAPDGAPARLHPLHRRHRRLPHPARRPLRRRVVAAVAAQPAARRPRGRHDGAARAERDAARPTAVWFSPPAGLEAYAHNLDVSSVTDAQFGGDPIVPAARARAHRRRPAWRWRSAWPRRSPRRCTTAPPPGVHPEQFLVAWPPPTSVATPGPVARRRSRRLRRRPAVGAPRRRHRRPPPPPPPPPPPATAAPAAAASTAAAATAAGRRPRRARRRRHPARAHAPLTAAPDDEDRLMRDGLALPRPRRQLAAAARGAGGDGRGARRRATATRRAPTRWRGPAARRSTTPAPSWPRSSAPRPARSCSRAAAPRPTTSPCAACWRARGGTAVCTAIEHKAVLEPVRASGGRVVPVDDRGVWSTSTPSRPSSTTPSRSCRSGSSTTRSAPCSRSTTIADVVRERAPAGACSTPTPPRRSRWLDVARRPPRPPTSSRWPRTSAAARSGVGALVVRAGVTLAPQQIGGGQERERRSGTQDVASAVAFAAAAAARRPTALGAGRADERLARRPRDGDRDRRPGHPRERGARRDRPATTSSPASPTCACRRSTARRCSSCSSTTTGCWPAPRRAARAAPRSRRTCWRRSGIDRALAAGSLRLSLGWSTTQADIDAAVEAVPAAAARLQAHARDGAPA